jgi:hypothetical protein
MFPLVRSRMLTCLCGYVSIRGADDGPLRGTAAPSLSLVEKSKVLAQTASHGNQKESAKSLRWRELQRFSLVFDRIDTSSIFLFSANIPITHHHHHHHHHTISLLSLPCTLSTSLSHCIHIFTNEPFSTFTCLRASSVRPLSSPLFSSSSCSLLLSLLPPSLSPSPRDGFGRHQSPQS